MPADGSWQTGDRPLQCIAFLATRTGTLPMTGSIKDSRH
jgi:hypothetical protein